MSERPLEETVDLFVGKTIQKVDVTSCNVEFLFTDGSRVALQIVHTVRRSHEQD